MTRAELQALVKSMRDEFQDVEFALTRGHPGDGIYLVRCRVRVGEEVGIVPHETVNDARRHLHIQLDNLLGSTSEAGPPHVRRESSRGAAERDDCGAASSAHDDCDTGTPVTVAVGPPRGALE